MMGALGVILTLFIVTLVLMAIPVVAIGFMVWCDKVSKFFSRF